MSLAKLLGRPSSRVLFVSIGPNRIECGVMAGGGTTFDWVEGSVVEVCFDPEWGMESLVQVLGGLLPKLQKFCPISQVRVVIADRWLALGSIPWSHNMRNVSSSTAYGKSQLNGVGFEVGQDDILRFDDMPFGAPRLAVAYSSLLMTALGQLSKSLGARLASVLPLSVAAWQVIRKEQRTYPAGLVILADGLLLFAIGDETQRAALREVVVRVGEDAGPGSQSLHHLYQAWQRLCLRDPRLSRIEQFQVLNLAETRLPGSLEKPFAKFEWTTSHRVTKWEKEASAYLCLAALSRSVVHSLDVVPAKSALTSGQLLSLGAVLLFSGFMTTQAIQMSRSNQELEDRTRAASNGTPAPVLSAAWSNEERARIQSVNAAIRELNLPISPILRALQPPQDIRVAVLSVETSALASISQFSSIKITAEAQTGAEMARYVAFVAERKPFTGAYLLRHEIDEESVERPYRFTVEIQWND